MKKIQSFVGQIFPPFRTQCQRKKKYGHVGPNQRVGLVCAGSKKFKGLGNCILESAHTQKRKRNFFESLIEDWSSFDSHTHSRVSF